MNSRLPTPDSRLKVLAIVGPTATGKSRLALNIAEKVPSEIVSADSMQIYKSMDIGTAKINPNVRRRIKHHLIDIISIKEAFNVVAYQKMARRAINEIHGQNKLPILVGGTGLYVRSALYKLDFPQKASDEVLRIKLEKTLKDKGLPYLQKELESKDPEAFGTIDINNSRRVIRALEILQTTGKSYCEFRHDWHHWQALYDNLLVGLTMPRQLLYQSIDDRVDKMLEAGLLEETKKLADESLREAIVAKQALGYKELIEYLDGVTSLKEAVETIKKRTRNYAKRQYTWFKKDPNIVWFDTSKLSIEEIANQIISLINKKHQAPSPK